MTVEQYIEDIKELLYSKIHEERLCALLILVAQFENGNEEDKKKVFNFYIKNVRQVMGILYLVP